jgi:hypothetical protein
VKITVWVDAWQMQCCRSNFRVGSRVSWTLTDPGTDWLMTVLGDDVTVDAAEEHHGAVLDDTPLTAVTVTAIGAVHCRYAPGRNQDERTLTPVRSSAVLTPVTSADGWTPDRDGLHFAGYLVDVAV